MAGIDSVVETARRYIIKRPRLTRLLDKANARVLMLIAPAGFGKTTLAREWVAERPHVWYRGTAASADVAALAAGLADVASEVIPNAGDRILPRMRAAGTPEQDVDVLAELFAEDLAEWPEDTWLVIDDYQFAMDAKAPERFVDILLRKAPVRLLLTSCLRPGWASARRLLYGKVYELGRAELAMDHDEAAWSSPTGRTHRPPVWSRWPRVARCHRPSSLTDDFDLPEGITSRCAIRVLRGGTLTKLPRSPKSSEGLCRLALAPSLGDGVAELLLGTTGADHCRARSATRLSFDLPSGTPPSCTPCCGPFSLSKGLRANRGRERVRHHNV